jgi:hypothetical protein
MNDSKLKLYKKILKIVFTTSALAFLATTILYILKLHQSMAQGWQIDNNKYSKIGEIIFTIFFMSYFFNYMINQKIDPKNTIYKNNKFEKYSPSIIKISTILSMIPVIIGLLFAISIIIWILGRIFVFHNF